MEHFSYRPRELYCEDVPVRALAQHYGTPLWVYSRRAILDRLGELQQAFAPAEPLICYSIKSNANLAICRLVQSAGAGFDVTSGGELFRALKSGGIGRRIVFAGAGKTDDEIRYGLDAEVLMFNVESAQELAAIARIAAEKNRIASVALRVNPDVDPKTHQKTTTGKKGTKFGLDWDTVAAIAEGMVGQKHVVLRGIHMHLGSPILSSDPYQAALARAAPLIDALRHQGHKIDYLNVGGGFGISYRGNEAPPAAAFAEVILPAVRAAGCRLILEPGRFVVGNAGILVSRVIYTKESGGRRFVIQDAAMNDLIRPALYDSYHRIWPVRPAEGFPAPPADFQTEVPGTQVCDVVGPVCESGDILARDRALPPMKSGDLLAVFSAGAYGMAMSSNYNGRLRAAEVMVDGGSHRLVRRRETFDDLVRPELEVD